jgi:hypothetical protein
MTRRIFGAMRLEVLRRLFELLKIELRHLMVIVVNREKRRKHSIVRLFLV